MAKEIRTIKKSFRFTQREWTQIEEKCKQADITSTLYFQQIAVTGKTASRNCHKEIKELTMQIAKIGNNLNQIARQLNSGKSTDLSILQTLLRIEKSLQEVLPP